MLFLPPRWPLWQPAFFSQDMSAVTAQWHIRRNEMDIWDVLNAAMCDCNPFEGVCAGAPEQTLELGRREQTYAAISSVTPSQQSAALLATLGVVVSYRIRPAWCNSDTYHPAHLFCHPCLQGT
jgi:hypothetical protein